MNPRIFGETRRGHPWQGLTPAPSVKGADRYARGGRGGDGAVRIARYAATASLALARETERKGRFGALFD